MTVEQALYWMAVIEREFGSDSEQGAALMLTLLECPEEFIGAYLEAHLDGNNYYARMARRFLIEHGTGATFGDMKQFMAQQHR